MSSTTALVLTSGFQARLCYPLSCYIVWLQLSGVLSGVTFCCEARFLVNAAEGAALSLSPAAAVASTGAGAEVADPDKHPASPIRSLQLAGRWLQQLAGLQAATTNKQVCLRSMSVRQTLESGGMLLTGSQLIDIQHIYQQLRSHL
jgi:hypothetical protein